MIGVNPHLIRQIADFAESGHTPTEIAELMSIPVMRVRRFMRSYGISTVKPLPMPARPPMHKLMGGR